VQTVSFLALTDIEIYRKSLMRQSYCVTCTLSPGRAIAQAVSRRLPTAAAQI
jgi:hypothetical protein